MYFLTRTFLRKKYIFQTKKEEKEPEVRINLIKDEKVLRVAMANQKLKELWDVYEKTKDWYAFTSIKNIEDNNDSIYSTAPSPDQGLGNIINEFKQDPEVFFIPHCYFKDPKGKDSEFPKCINVLKDTLSNAFISGKKLVGKSIIKFYPFYDACLYRSGTR